MAGLAKGGKQRGKYHNIPTAKAIQHSSTTRPSKVGKLYRYILRLIFHLFHLKYALPLQNLNRLPHFKKVTNKGKQVLMNMMFNFLH
jgi:hypothetical protein